MLRSTLEGQGTACVVRNELLSIAKGDVPPTECFPALPKGATLKGTISASYPVCDPPNQMGGPGWHIAEYEGVLYIVLPQGTGQQ